MGVGIYSFLMPRKSKYGVPVLLPSGRPNPEYERRHSEARRRARGQKPWNEWVEHQQKNSKYGIRSQLPDGRLNPAYTAAMRRAKGIKPHPSNWGNTYGVPYNLSDGRKNPEYYKRQYEAKGDKYRETNKRWRMRNRKTLSQKRKVYYETNKVTLLEQEAAWRLQEKNDFFDHYGWACVGCGEREKRFLTADHINNDGADHRRTGNINLYHWAKANGYPLTLQTLCWNCQREKEHNRRRMATRYNRGMRYADKAKRYVIDYYGGVCYCCGERDINKLTLGHPNNDGHMHRKMWGGGNISYRKLYRMLKNHLPIPFKLRTECSNCNNGAYLNGGVCPHNTK